jgi:hypothetical protein
MVARLTLVRKTLRYLIGQIFWNNVPRPFLELTPSSSNFQLIDSDKNMYFICDSFWIICTSTASKPSEEFFSRDEIMIMVARLTPSSYAVLKPT